MNDLIDRLPLALQLVVSAVGLVLAACVAVAILNAVLP
jgi:hypothetical protein